MKKGGTRWRSRRYFTRAAAIFRDDETGEDSVTADQVIEEDDEPIDTGLLDSYGEPLFRFRERWPIGFHIGGDEDEDEP